MECTSGLLTEMRQSLDIIKSLFLKVSQFQRCSGSDALTFWGKVPLWLFLKFQCDPLNSWIKGWNNIPSRKPKVNNNWGSLVCFRFNMAAMLKCMGGVRYLARGVSLARHDNFESQQNRFKEDTELKVFFFSSWKKKKNPQKHRIRLSKFNLVQEYLQKLNVRFL